MKTNRTSKLSRGFALAAGGFALLAPALQAQTFTYTNADLLLSFRLSGQPDLVVDIGQPSFYDAVPAGSTVSLPGLSVSLPTLLGNTYPTLDNLNWSVLGAERNNNNVSYPLQTIWVSAGRTSTAVQSAPWLRQSAPGQAAPASIIAAIGNNAVTYGSVQAASQNNALTSIVIPASNANAYTPLVSDPYNGAQSDLHGTFKGYVENTTPDDFDSSEPLSVSDLYELLPGSGALSGTPGKWVGWFSFTPDGHVTFTAAPTVTVPQPTITSIQRNGTVTTVSFTTANGFTYTLLSTNATGLRTARSTWATGASVVGNGSVLSLQDTVSSGTGFYAIGVH